MSTIEEEVITVSGPTLMCDDQMTVECIMLTPAIAEEFMTHNLHNRPIRPNKVAAYARDIKAGSWRRSPQPIMFDVNGKMIDGQHRCHAVIQTSIPVWTLVVRGVDTDVQEVIDTQGVRSAANALFLSERVEVNHPSVAALARAHILWTEGHAPHHQWRPNVNASRNVTNVEIEDWVDAQNALAEESPETVTGIDAVTMATEEWSHVRYLSKPVLALAYMLLAEVDREAAEGFFTSLNNSEFGYDEALDPVKQLQARLILARKDKEGLRIGQQLWLIFTAWNAYRKEIPLEPRFIADISKPAKDHAAVNPVIGKDRTTGQPYFPPVPMPI